MHSNVLAFLLLIQVYQEINDFKRYIHSNKKINIIKYMKLQEEVAFSQCTVTVFTGLQTDWCVLTLRGLCLSGSFQRR